MSELKVSPGYATIEEEFEASLKRAFVDHGANYITLYDKRHRFLFESVAYGQEKSWLGPIEEHEFDEQDVEWRFRLTDAGKKHFGIEVEP